MPAGDAFRRPTPDASAPKTVALPAPPPELERTHPGPQTRSDFNAFDEAFVRCYPAALDSAMDRLLAALPRVEDGDVLEGAAAFEYMVALRQQMVLAATDVAGQYDSETWLRLIRRLGPHALTYAESGTMDHEGDSTQRVAENLVGTARGTRFDTEATTTPTDVSMKLARLMALAGMVDSLEGAVRSATKGVKYKVARHRRPRPWNSDELRESLREFDIRNSWKTADGVARLTEHTSVDLDGDPPMLVAYRFQGGVAPDQTWNGPFRSDQTQEKIVQFTVRMFTTGDETYTVLGRHGVLASFDNPEATASLIVLGNALLGFILEHAENAGQSIPRLGLVDVAADELLSLLERTLDSQPVAEWLDANEQSGLTAARVLDQVRERYVQGERSLPGPIVQEREGRTTVDVWAYTWHVTHELKLSPHTGGAIANLSAEEFELASQELINQSVFAPPASIQAMRGRTLKLNGKQITDVDALLVAGTKLFLVSCKKFLTKVSYLAGEYSAARNGRTRLDKALDEWHDRIATLRTDPIGDNYDFSGYDIEGFVLLRELIFTPRKDSRDLLPVGHDDLFFTRVESFSQFAATLEMASWAPEPSELRALRLAGA